MSLGGQIRKYRLKAGYTQEVLAEALGVTPPSVSNWENGHFEPDLSTLKSLANVLQVPVSALLEEQTPPDWVTDNRLFDDEHMYTFVKTAAKMHGLGQTLWALPFAREAHSGQLRRAAAGEPVAYINHPLTIACHALALGLYDDDLIAAALLHDVMEDCGKTEDDLRVNDRVKRAVRLVTKEPHPADKQAADEKYYQAILTDPLACMVKALDRCNNVSCMATGFTREKMAEYVRTTDRYYPAILDVLKGTRKWNDAAWLIRYQLGSLIEAYKRLL